MSLNTTAKVTSNDGITQEKSVVPPRVLSKKFASVILDPNKLYHDELYHYYRKKNLRKKRKKPVERWIEAQRVKHKGAGLDGDNIVANIRGLLKNGFSIRRSEMQWKVHEACIKAMIPKIYGEEWDQNQGRILKHFRLNRLFQEVMIIMSRRQGKSWSVGMIAAAFILFIPEFTIAIFATGKRMAAALMDITKKMLKRAFRYSNVSQADYSVKKASAELVVYEGPDGTERKLACLPGSARVSLIFYFYFPMQYVCIFACVFLRACNGKHSHSFFRRLKTFAHLNGKSYCDIFIFTFIKLLITGFAVLFVFSVRIEMSAEPNANFGKWDHNKMLCRKYKQTHPGTRCDCTWSSL